jgi:hypothetical protein
VKPERFALIGPQAEIGLPPTSAGGREVRCCRCRALLARTIPTYLLGLSSQHGAPIADGRTQWVSLTNEIVVEFEPGLDESDRSAAGRRVVRPTGRALRRRGRPRPSGGINRPRRITVKRFGSGTVTTRRVLPDHLVEQSNPRYLEVPDPLASMSLFDGAPFEIHCLAPDCQTRQTVDWSRREGTPG